MTDKKTFGKVFPKSEAVCKIFSEYEVHVPQGRGTFMVTVKILQHNENEFSFELSHHYMGKIQQAPYVTSRGAIFGTEEEALKAANLGIFTHFYDKTEAAVWNETTASSFAGDNGTFSSPYLSNNHFLSH